MIKDAWDTCTVSAISLVDSLLLLTICVFVRYFLRSAGFARVMKNLESPGIYNFKISRPGKS